MGHTGNYSREEAIAAIDKERTLPDVPSFNPSKPAKYPNGRVFTDDVIDCRLAFLTKGECPPSGLKPHTDIGVSVYRHAASEVRFARCEPFIEPCDCDLRRAGRGVLPFRLTCERCMLRRSSVSEPDFFQKDEPCSTAETFLLHRLLRSQLR
jgi:hypothetical protein